MCGHFGLEVGDLAVQLDAGADHGAGGRRLFFKLFNSGILDRGHLTIRQREIVIDRVTAQCGAGYEWGVHVAVYATKSRAERTGNRITGGGRCER
jgi:hypothetical protein